MNIVLEYRTQKDYCHCCEQKLITPKISEVQEFKLNKENLRNSHEWQEISEDKDELQEIIIGYVYDTIRYFATSWNEQILIENSEIEKVKNFILNEVIA